MALRRFATVLGLVLVAGMTLFAQTQRPDFSGAWQQDAEASRALTLKNGGEWRVAGAGMSGGAAPSNAQISRPILTYTQSDRELIIETRYGDEVLRREVFKLDGTVSVNATSNITNRSTTVWKGASLVTSGSMHFDFSDGSARDASGKPLREMTRDFTTTRTLMPDGTMHVVSHTLQDGKERTQWSVLVRVKK